MSLTKEERDAAEFERLIKKYEDAKNESLRWQTYQGIYNWYTEEDKLRIGNALINECIEARAKLSCKMYFCVYCGRPLRHKYSGHMRRWNAWRLIGTNSKDRYIEKTTFFDDGSICLGCANTEFAIGRATEACEIALTKLNREIRAQAH